MMRGVLVTILLLVFSCALALALTGCNNLPPQPVLPPPPKVVYVPTPIACIAPRDIPAEPARVPQAGTVADDLRIAASQAVKLRTWGEKLFGIAQGCATIGSGSV